MKIDDKIRDEKMQYNVNRKSVKISALLSGKVYKHKYYKGEQILPSDQSRMIEPNKLNLH